jgi:hypothetical protein
MTLVVARVVEGTVRILSDWKVTWAEERWRTPFTGALKAIAVSPDLAVAYSTNHLDAMLPVLRTAVHRSSNSGALTLAEALRPHTDDDVHEFLVAARSTMHVVRAGRILTDQLVANLGDGNAFAEYQRHCGDLQVLDTEPAGDFSAEFFRTISRMANGVTIVGWRRLSLPPLLNRVRLPNDRRQSRASEPARAQWRFRRWLQLLRLRARGMWRRRDRVSPAARQGWWPGPAPRER